MSARVQWSGLRELVEALAKAPQNVRDDGMAIIRDATESTAADVRSAYTGTLRARVRTTYPSSDLLVGIVQSTAPHSHLYEFGTGPRSFNGANRGQMPKAANGAGILVPAAQRHRLVMFERLKALLVGLGFRLE